MSTVSPRLAGFPEVTSEKSAWRMAPEPMPSRSIENTPGAVAEQAGDVDKALASAPTKIEAAYEVPFLAHATMEPMNCTAHVREGRCEVWVGTQVMARAQAAAAKAAGAQIE